MKIAEIDSKYIDYIRNHELVEHFNIYDEINSLEFDENTPYEIRNLMFDSKIMEEEYPDELQRELYLDQAIIDFECACENQRKFEQDPEYDIDPWKDEYTEDQMAILEANKIPVWVETPEGTLVQKYIDARMLDGSLWKTKD